jgi:hypothetical protein
MPVGQLEKQTQKQNPENQGKSLIEKIGEAYDKFRDQAITIATEIKSSIGLSRKNQQEAIAEIFSNDNNTDPKALEMEKRAKSLTPLEAARNQFDRLYDDSSDASDLKSLTEPFYKQILALEKSPKVAQGLTEITFNLLSTLQENKILGHQKYNSLTSKVDSVSPLDNLDLEDYKNKPLGEVVTDLSYIIMATSDDKDKHLDLLIKLRDLGITPDEKANSIEFEKKAFVSDEQIKAFDARLGEVTNEARFTSPFNYFWKTDSKSTDNDIFVVGGKKLSFESPNQFVNDNFPNLNESQKSILTQNIQVALDKVKNQFPDEESIKNYFKEITYGHIIGSGWYTGIKTSITLPFAVVYQIGETDFQKLPKKALQKGGYIDLEKNIIIVQENKSFKGDIHLLRKQVGPFYQQICNKIFGNLESSVVNIDRKSTEVANLIIQNLDSDVDFVSIVDAVSTKLTDFMLRIPDLAKYVGTAITIAKKLSILDGYASKEKLDMLTIGKVRTLLRGVPIDKWSEIDSVLNHKLRQKGFPNPEQIGNRSKEIVVEPAKLKVDEKTPDKTEIWMGKRLQTAEIESQLTTYLLKPNLTQEEILEALPEFLAPLNTKMERKIQIMLNIDKLFTKINSFDQKKYGLSREYPIMKLPFANVLVINNDTDFYKSYYYLEKQPEKLPEVKGFLRPDEGLITVKDYITESNLKHEYQHAVFKVLQNTDIYTEFKIANRKQMPDSTKYYLPETLNTREKIDLYEMKKFSNEILSHIAQNRDKESSKENNKSQLYDYTLDLMTRFNIDIPDNLKDRSNYFKKCDALIDVAYTIKDKVRSIYSNLYSDPYQIDLITVSLLRDTNIENWPKLIPLLEKIKKSIVAK